MAGCGEIQPEPAAATGTSVNPTASVAPDAGSTPAARPSGLCHAGPEAGPGQHDGGVAAGYPLADASKSRVYQRGVVRGVPEAIIQRTPTTDTFSLPQTQEEFFFGLPYTTLDAVLHARNAGWSVVEAAERLGLTPEGVERAWSDLAQKRATTRYLHLHSLLVEPVDLGEGAPG